MVKKVILPIVALCVVALVGFTAFGIYKSVSSRPTFPMDGYVLQGEVGEAKQLGFQGQDTYQISRTGQVVFRDKDGKRAVVRAESFVCLDDGSIMALCGGVLLDFNDLSENFINNYFITAKLPIDSSGNSYTAATNSGTVTFGENLWKLSESKYMVRSSELTIHFAEGDERPAGEYVQVTTTEDGIVQLLTEENLWTTISPECYIQTANGIKVNPVTQIAEDGRNKLSLAKISVGADDQIVLTESETRRQIVPELKLEAVDGEDGADGDAGQNGEQGIAGEKGVNGEKGENGEKGIDGEKGTAGEQGVTGKDGAQGTDGKQGTTGANGQTGANGAAGSSGPSGSSGSSGQNGSSGRAGYAGNKGNDATLQSSTNAALPVMSFVDWQVSATSLKGAIQVTDETGLLEIDSTADNKYAPSVTIYEVDTGRKIACYEVTNSDYDLTGAEEFKNNSFQDEGTTYFTTSSGIGGARSSASADVLTPDTSYRISVVAYYKMSGMIYSREFISRFFYTDSTGLHLSYDSADTGRLTINAKVADSYKDAIMKAEILLLTPEQNRNLATENSACVAKYSLDYQSKTIDYYDGTLKKTFRLSGQPGIDEMLTFGDIASDGTDTSTALTPNQKYVARVYVSTKSTGNTMSVLTNQALDMSTLRRSPYMNNNSDKPGVNYNRTTGAFEVYHPTVTDQDGGTVRYIYTVMQSDGSGEWTEVPGAKKTALPNENGPVNFFLPSNTEYRFKVDLEFNDNEKTVSYNLGTSESIMSTGDTLPRLTLEKDADVTEYNAMKGKLHIDMTQESTKLKVDKDHLLILEVYADQIYDRKIQIDNDTGTAIKLGKEDTLIYSATLDRRSAPNSNRATVELELNNLYKNTNYTILVTGYIDLNDGNGFTRRVLGSTSFRTLAPMKLNAVWELESGGDSASVSRLLKLELQKEDTGDEEYDAQREAYAYDQLKKGQVTLKISRGTGPSRMPMNSISLTNGTAKKVEDLYTSGVQITDRDFTLTLDAGTTYTLEVDVVSDQTYGMDIGYLNTFEVSVATKTEVVTGKAKPPELLTDPTKGVTAEPIYNKDAELYGGIYDKKLPDDVIVGYCLAANYDNSQRLGQTVTYYPFEYNNFYNALKTNQDPVALQMHKDENSPNYTVIEPITLDIPAGSNDAPKVAILFGGGKDQKPVAQNNFYNGYYCYYAGDADTSSGYLKGMGRGFRYVFAYTVEWSENAAGSSQTYPYSPSSNYNNFKSAYGAGKENGVDLGLRVAYILNSGMKSAPRIAPEFHTYVYDTKESTWQESYSNISSGTLEIHYTWRDLDNTIVTTGQPEDLTKIKYSQGAGAKEEPLFDAERKLDSAKGSLEWYSIVIPYEAKPGGEMGENVLEPIVNISLYKIKYDSTLAALGYTSSEEGEENEDIFYLCHIPLDRAYGKRFENLKALNTKAYVQMDPHLDDNYIDFKLTAEGGSDITTDLGKRAYAMKLNVRIETEETSEDQHPQTIYLPMRYGQGSYYARLATGALGAEYVGKTFIVDAEIFYDTGDQGWKLIEDEEEGVRSNFAMQRIQQTDEGYMLGGYVAGGSGTSGTYGAMAQQVPTSGGNIMTADIIRGLVQTDSENDHTSLIRIKGISEAWEVLRYIYPIQQGVAQGNNSSLKELSDCVVPKGVGSYALEFPQDKNTCTLDRMTPTIQKGEFYTGATQVDVFSFTIMGQQQAGTETYIHPTTNAKMENQYVVHALLFDTEYKATQFATAVDNEARQNAKNQMVSGSEILMRLGDGTNGTTAGRPIVDKKSADDMRDTGIIRSLEQGKNYWVVFYMMDKKGEMLILVDQTTAQKAVYSFQTAADLQITSEDGLVYKNTGYFNKSLNLVFNLSRTSGVIMEYTLLDSLGRTIYTDKEMRENGMLQANKTGFTGSNNSVTIKMIPSELRKELKPGGTYKLHLQATEQGGTEIGEQEFTVNLPPVTNYGALIYVSKASSTSLTFTVSINDVGYSIMGHDKVGQGVGLYAVRFTDEEDNWIQTIYDGQVFDTAQPKQDFRLQTGPEDQGGTIIDTGITLDQNKTYRINIYAVVDKDHDGLSELVPVSSGSPEGQDYKYFFGQEENPTMVSAGAKFAEFLRQFWGDGMTGSGTTGIPKILNNTVWEIGLKFRLAQKSQKLTSNDGLLVNENGAFLSRRGNRLVLTLSESFGVSTAPSVDYPNGEQAFRKVEWQIEGYTWTADGQVIVSHSGTTPTSENPFKVGKDVAGYDIFTYEINQDIPMNGFYTVVIKLYKNDTDPAAYKTLSFRYNG